MRRCGLPRRRRRTKVSDRQLPTSLLSAPAAAGSFLLLAAVRVVVLLLLATAAASASAAVSARIRPAEAEAAAAAGGEGCGEIATPPAAGGGENPREGGGGGGCNGGSLKMNESGIGGGEGGCGGIETTDRDPNNVEDGDHDHDGEEEEEGGGGAAGNCTEDDNGTTATCGSTILGYDSLLLQDPATDEELGEAWHDGRPTTCAYDDVSELDWHTVQAFKSVYQAVEFCRDPRDGDLCLDLDNTIQICESYRPHYHELMVHYPARYLPTGLGRVAFVGGGDSMLLHEVLKYPELQLVAGFELDQQVTRGSFRHFGSRPHWDDPRVEWWYGDATKSLSVIPRSYYGSFDLVLVDLSETVMALSVTGGLDVMHSLAHLLKPDGGIFVQNEIMHFFEISGIFRYAAHAHLYDVPVVCSQSIVFGSQSIDLLRAATRTTRTRRDDVQYLMSHLWDDDDQVAALVHDYQRNDSNKAPTTAAGGRVCRPPSKKDNGGDAAEGGGGPATAKAAASAPPPSGVLMVADAELPSEGRLMSSESVLAAVVEAIAGQGFELVSSSASSSSSDGNVTKAAEAAVVRRAAAILREGYVAVHCLPAIRYCSADVHLWTGLGRQAGLRSALVSALADGGSSTGRGGDEAAEIKVSSFRIVAGGMAGARGQEEDARSRGLLSVPVCDDEDDAAADDSGDGGDALPAATEDDDDDASQRRPGPQPPAPSSFRWQQYRQVLERATHLIPPTRSGAPADSGGGAPARLVAVLCGRQADEEGGREDCQSAAALREAAAGGDDGAYRVLELRACAGIADGVECDVEPATAHYRRCEEELVREMAESVCDGGGKLDAIVVDPNAPLAMGQIVLHIFQDKATRTGWLADERLLVVAPMAEPWQGVLVDRFRTHVFEEEPLYRAEVQLRLSGHDGDGAATGVALCSSGDALFARRLNGTLADLERAAPGLSAEVHLLRGAWEYRHREGKASATYTHLDYDQRPSFAQWQAQREVLRQTVAQFALPPAAPADRVAPAAMRAAIERAATYVLGAAAAASSSRSEWLDRRSSRRVRARWLVESSSIGDGALVVAMLEGFTVALVWDGQSMMTANIVTYGAEDDSFGAELLSERKEAFGLELALLDQHPRGTGSVVNWREDTEGVFPHWAEALQASGGVAVGS